MSWGCAKLAEARLRCTRAIKIRGFTAKDTMRKRLMQNENRNPLRYYLTFTWRIAQPISGLNVSVVSS